MTLVVVGLNQVGSALPASEVNIVPEAIVAGEVASVTVNGGNGDRQWGYAVLFISYPAKDPPFKKDNGEGPEPVLEPFVEEQLESAISVTADRVRHNGFHNNNDDGLIDELIDALREYQKSSNNHRNPSYREKLTDLLSELNSNWRIPQDERPGKMGKMIEMFLSSRNGTVSLDDLAPLFEGTYDERRSASNMMGYLDKRLSEEGYKIEKSKVYRIVRLGEEDVGEQ